MKEITVMSGKGGAGKTTVTAALASIAGNAVYCDNDVDAADLHLIFRPVIKEQHTYGSGKKAVILPEQCSNCGLCAEKCRFDAIKPNAAGLYEINPLQCEGCRLCERICTENSINIIENNNNFWYVSDTRFGTLIHARMSPGEENSGRLITRIRKKAQEAAREMKSDFIISDGPPGIGCAAISTITGTDLVLLVIEPTLSGLHDAKRLVELVENFDIPVLALINKFDLNTKISKDVLSLLNEKKINLIGKIHFNNAVVESMVHGQTIVEFSPNSKLSKEFYYIWDKIRNRITK